MLSALKTLGEVCGASDEACPSTPKAAGDDRTSYRSGAGGAYMAWGGAWDERTINHGLEMESQAVVRYYRSIIIGIRLARSESCECCGETMSKVSILVAPSRIWYSFTFLQSRPAEASRSIILASNEQTKGKVAACRTWGCWTLTYQPYRDDGMLTYSSVEPQHERIFQAAG